MCATNSASASGGITQCSSFRRVIRFLSVRRMVSWLTDSTIASSTTRRASSRNDQWGIALRGRPRTQGDDACLLVAVEQFRDRRRGPPLALQRPLEAFQHASLADALNRLRAAREGVGDLLVGPPRSVRIGLQENLRTAHLLAAAVELPDRVLTDIAFLGGESDDVPFLHGNSIGPACPNL